MALPSYLAADDIQTHLGADLTAAAAERVTAATVEIVERFAPDAPDSVKRDATLLFTTHTYLRRERGQA